MARAPGAPERQFAGTNRTTEYGPEHDLRALFGQSTAVFVSLAGPAHVVEAASTAFFYVIGGGQPARTGVPLGQLDLTFLLMASTALTSDLGYAQTLQRLAASCVPALAPLCTVDIADAGRIRRIATAATTSEQEQLLYGHLAPPDDGGLNIALVRAGHPPPLHIDCQPAVRPSRSRDLSSASPQNPSCPFAACGLNPPSTAPAAREERRRREAADAGEY